MRHTTSLEAVIGYTANSGFGLIEQGLCFFIFANFFTIFDYFSNRSSRSECVVEHWKIIKSGKERTWNKETPCLQQILLTDSGFTRKSTHFTTLMFVYLYFFLEQICWQTLNFINICTQNNSLSSKYNR